LGLTGFVLPFCLMTPRTRLHSFILAHIYIHSLAGWIHGVFNSQGYGIWRILFPNMNPIFGGHTGLLGTLVLLILGWATMRWLARHSEGKKSL